jgi:hypothetical protein
MLGFHSRNKGWRWGIGAVSANKPILNFLIDGNPHKVPWMVPTRDWAPPLFLPTLSMTATVINHGRGRDRRASTAATGRRIVPSFPESLWGRARGVLTDRSGSGMERQRGGQQSTRGILGQNGVDQGSAVPNSFTVADLGGGSRQVVPPLATQPRSLYQC